MLDPEQLSVEFLPEDVKQNTKFMVYVGNRENHNFVVYYTTLGRVDQGYRMIKAFCGKMPFEETFELSLVMSTIVYHGEIVQEMKLKGEHQGLNSGPTLLGVVKNAIVITLQAYACMPDDAKLDNPSPRILIAKDEAKKVYAARCSDLGLDASHADRLLAQYLESVKLLLTEREYRLRFECC